MEEIYLDNSATTKPYPEVAEKVIEMLTKYYGNPSSIHRLGLESKSEVETARKNLADSLAVHPSEIYFTSGGTESNNIAIKGACLAKSNIGNHIVTTVAEHPSVTKTVRDLKRQGWKVSYIPVRNGKLNIEKLENAIQTNTVLVSTMLVNNETGYIFPVRKIKEIIERKNSSALLHCDAVQGYGKLPFTADSLGADLITISSHKIHGPKGVGALYVKKDTPLYSLHLGGGQERGLRSGTENTPSIAGFGVAVKRTFDNMEENVTHIREIRDYCLESVQNKLPQAILHSSKYGAPHIVHFSLPGFLNSEVVTELSRQNIFISGAAACKSNHSRGPSMLESLGLTREMANSALRISLSYQNTKEDIDRLINGLKQINTLKELAEK
ncbi:cysteine desulfurase family protein [Bacillaceae bacterium S4-13-58]